MSQQPTLRPALGPLALTMLGVGAVIGTGIFVLTGTAASNHTGPALVRVDPATRVVSRAGRQVPLRPKEYELLAALLRRRGAVVGRTELLREVWGYHESVLSRTLDTHVGELRRKLEPDPGAPRYILTVRKSGYRLAV